MGAFSTPLSGLMAAQQQLETVSNNLANQNTDGYKDQNLTFRDIFAQTSQVNGAGDPIQTGSGVQVSSVISDQTEGSTNSTNIPSNMAISGNGYFVLENAAGQPAYTRAGDFTINNAGQMVDPDGNYVMGYPATNGVVNTTGALQPISISIGASIQGKQSSDVSITANLNAGNAAPTTLSASTAGGATTYTYAFANSATVDPTTSFTVDGQTVTPTAGESLSSYANALQSALSAAGSAATVSASGNSLTVTCPSGVSTSGTVAENNAGTTTNLTATSTVSPTTYTYDFGTSGTVDPGTSLTVDGHTVTASAGESVSDYAAALQNTLTNAGSTATVAANGNSLVVTCPNGTSQSGIVKDDSSAGTTSSLQVYDSLGGAHTLSVNYSKTGANTWAYSVSVPSSDITAGATGSTVVGSGTLNFDPSTGSLSSITGTTPISIPTLADGASPMTLTGPFGSTGNYTITQTSNDSTTSAAVTDGYLGGTLKTYTIATDGTIEGTFSSGKTFALGQVAVANFANVQGLSAVGDNAYQPTIASGSAIVGVPNTGGRGTILGGEVEQSNVNIAAEFSKLIVAQQAYAANAKSITTFNQVSQATLQMIQ